jgi:hypothetical protein
MRAMRLNWMLPVAAATLLLAAAPLALGESDPWAAMARHDLTAIHDILKENHPGPVDAENPRYGEWLEDGLAAANRRADSAASLDDYERALRFYTNGFQDGHIGIGLEVQSNDIAWPGFIVGAGSTGGVEVTYAEPDSGVVNGAALRSCDGRTLDELLAERVDPYYWNSAIPHERYSHADRLLYHAALDPRKGPESCTFSSGEVRLKLRRTERDSFVKTLEAARGGGSREPRVRQLGRVWMISIPTLAYNGEEKVKRIRAVIAEIAAKAPKLRKSRVVFDVRGNHGGNSDWGEEIAAALWGKPWVDRVTNGFDNTADWRASPSNLAAVDGFLRRERASGLTESVAYLQKVHDAMAAALEARRPLARVDSPPKPTKEPPPADPIAGRVYLFTDGVCASACLDFADLLRRLPGVRHAGLPTSADAIYIDNTYARLPSGLAGLGYSMKVFRNRVRKNNEWYEPQVRWPGGEMTDEAVARWIASLP